MIDFIEIAASDASLDSPSNDLLSRISAISALGSVLSIIGPSIETIDYFSDSYTPSYKKSQQYHDTRYGTSTFLQSIYHLRDRGHLKRILLHVGLVDKSSSTSTCTSTTTTNTIPPPPPGLLEATLTLCSHIGSCRDGSNILLEYGVLLGINSLPIIPLPTSTSSNTAATSVEEENLFPLYSTTSGTNSHNNSTYTDEDIQIILEPTLRLLNVLGSTSPCYEILQQCCYFLINNSTIISYYLHLKLPTLKGLSIIYSILNLMCLIAPATTSTTTTTTSATTTTVPPSTSTSTITVSIWEIEMGPKGDMYTTNLNRLCRIFSSKPLPTWNHFNRMNSSFYLKKEQKYSWWTIIKPSTPYEENLNEKIILPPNCIKFNGNLDYPINWTKFDDLKFLLGLKILERISSFFRMRSNLCIMNSHGIRRGSMYNTSMESATSSIVVSIPSTPNPFPTHTAGTFPAGTPGTSSWMNNNPQSTISIGDAIGLLAINMDDISYSFESIASFYYHISSIFHHPHPQQDDNSKNGGGNNNLSWLRESHTLSSPFDSIMKKRSIYEPNNPYKTSGSATPAATAGATATVPPGGTAATRNGTTTDHQILQINEIDYEINKLLLYTTESLLCTIYDLVILSSSSSSSSSIESSTWKNELMNCLQITEKFPSHSFIRQISRYILNQINEIIIVRK